MLPTDPTLGDLVSVRRESVQADSIDEDCYYVALEHMTSGTGAIEPARAGDTSIRSNKARFQCGDILYGKLRPNLRKCGVVDVGGVCSTDILALTPHDKRMSELLALYLRSESFTARVMRLVGGANLPRVKPRDLLSLPIALPAEDQLNRSAELARLALRARREIRDLEEAVDSLERSIVSSGASGSANDL